MSRKRKQGDGTGVTDQATPLSPGMTPVSDTTATGKDSDVRQRLEAFLADSHRRLATDYLRRCGMLPPSDGKAK